MSDLPVGDAKCDVILQPNPAYRAIYQCVSYITRATGSAWHASVPVPDRPDFLEIDISVGLPPNIAEKFRLNTIQRNTRTDDPSGIKFNNFILTFTGTPTLGNCPVDDKVQCIVEKAVSARVYYK